MLERYELLYEARLVDESISDAGLSSPASMVELGRPMAMDHRRILATALGRLRGKIKYRPVVFELLPPVFTLSRLQRVVEALAGARLHKQNFRRLVDHGGLVEGTGNYDEETGGRPAELFSFRREGTAGTGRAGRASSRVSVARLGARGQESGRPVALTFAVPERSLMKSSYGEH